MLGGELALQLARDGYTDITLPVRNLARLGRLLARMEAERLDPKVLHPVEVSLSFPEEMREVLKGAAALFHCAALVDFGDRDCNIVAGNVEITSTLVDAALECGVGIMVYVSSIAVLGESDPPGAPLTERNPLHSLDGEPPYTVSKFLSEQQVRRGMEQGLRAVIVQPSVILGEGRWRGAGSGAVVRLVSSGLPFFTTGVTGYVDVRDVARAMILLFGTEKAVGETFILNGHNVSFKEFITLAADAAGKPRPRFKAGRGLLGSLYTVEKIASLFGYRPRLSRLAVRSATSVTHYDGSKVKQYINIEYTPFEDTVRRVVKAYLDDKSGGDSSGGR